jgi:hypothetical protein
MPSVHASLVYKAQLKLNASQGRFCSLQEIRESSDIAQEDAKVRPQLLETINNALEHSKSFAVSLLRDEVEGFVRSRMLREALSGAAKRFNQGEDDGVADLLASAVDLVRSFSLDKESDSIQEFTLEELLSDPPDQGWLLENRIPDDPGLVGSISGPGSAGKTSLLVGFAMHRAMGLPFLGMKTKPGRTLVISTEDGRKQYLRKMAAWRVACPELDMAVIQKSVSFKDAVGSGLTMVSQGEGGLGVNEKAVDALAASVKRKGKYDLILMETMSRLTPQESNEGYSALISAGERLARKVGAVVCLVGHHSKDGARAGTNDAYATRGGAAISDNGRFTLQLTKFPDDPKKQEASFGVKITKEQAIKLSVFGSPKVNAGPPQPDLVLERVGNRFGLTYKLHALPTVDQFLKETLENDLGALVACVTKATESGKIVTEKTLSNMTAKELGFAKKNLGEVLELARERNLLVTGPVPRGSTSPTLLVKGEANV